MPGRKDCPKCKGEGNVREKDGSIHICFDCLLCGSMDQHDTKIKDAKDFGIRL